MIQPHGVPRFTLLAVALGLLTGALCTASAFTADWADNGYEIPLRQFDLPGYRSPEVERASLNAIDSFQARNGGNWRVYTWNPQTNTPSYFYGSGVDLGRALTTGDEVAALARDVIAANPEVFRASLENLRLESTAHGMGKWAAHFQQTYQGLDVWRGGVHLTFTDAGRLFVMGSSYYRGIDLDVDPTLSLAEAERIARADLPYDGVSDRIEEGSPLLVLPEPLSETDVAYHLVWRVRVHTADPVGIWVTHVDAHTGEIIWRYNDVHFVDFEGDAKLDVQPGTYCNGSEEQDLKYLRVQVETVGQTITDQLGLWSVPYGGSDAKTVRADLYGPYIDVNNSASGAPEAEFSGVFTPGTPITVRFDDTNSQRDERDCFDAVNDVHDFISLFDPDFGYINQRITCNVSINSTCNAYWNGTINFYQEGGGCANTGEIQGVVHHEFGHGIQDHILGWQGDQGLGEGNSDIMSNLITQESIIARGFYLGNCTSGIRNSLNNLTYPEDVIGQQIHYAGQVIAGFTWDFMVLMQGIYGEEAGAMMTGERWHFGRVLEHPTTQPDQVLATFIADDDDGNLDNGTPHHEQLCEAAMNHGFDCPEILVGVFIEHTPVASREEEGDVEVLATIYSYSAPLVFDDLTLSYRVNGGELVEEVLAPTGGQDEFSAIIPDLMQTSVVEYYLHAADEAGYEAMSPPGAPAEVYEFVVAPQVAILTDDIETGAPGWTHDVVSSGFSDQWHISNLRNHTPAGLSSWKCGDTGTGDYGNLLDAGLVTPEFELRSHSYLHYWQWIDAEESSAYEGRAYDGGLVEISVDGGPWTQIFPDEGYTHTIRDGSIPGPFEANTPVFSGNVDWHEINFNLGEFSGMAQIRFRFGTDGADTREGWYVDDVVIDGFLVDLSPVAEEIGASDLRFALHGSRANPVHGATEIVFETPAAVDARLSIFDVTGRTVRLLARESFGAGLHSVSWDGRDGGGRMVPSGVYYYRLQAGSFDETRMLVVSR